MGCTSLGRSGCRTPAQRVRTGQCSPAAGACTPRMPSSAADCSPCPPRTLRVARPRVALGQAMARSEEPTKAQECRRWRGRVLILGIVMIERRVNTDRGGTRAFQHLSGRRVCVGAADEAVGGKSFFRAVCGWATPPPLSVRPKQMMAAPSAALLFLHSFLVKERHVLSYVCWIQLYIFSSVRVTLVPLLIFFSVLPRECW